MKRVVLLAFALALGGAGPWKAMEPDAPPPSLGISYAELMDGLQFDLVEMAPVKGVPRYGGKAKSGLGYMQVIGEKADVQKAVMIVSLARNADGTAPVQNNLAATFMLHNVVPHCKEIVDWYSVAVKVLDADENARLQLTTEGKKITLDRVPKIGAISVVVEPSPPPPKPE